MLSTEKHLEDINKDKFRYKELSNKVLENILLKMDTPNCFGLFGNWGSGKSTLMHFLQKDIEEKDDVISVKFDAWKYEYAEKQDLLFALLRKIQTGLGCDNKTSIWKRLLLDSMVVGSGVLRATTNIDLQKTVKDFSFFESKIYSQHEQWVDKTESFEKTFTEAIQEGLKKSNNNKLIVFIDDLDRCLPENAVSLIEVIKNFLSVENVIFVLAIDKRVISEMIEKKYGLHSGYGEEYIAKIIPYSYQLPRVTIKEIVDEICTLYGFEDLDTNFFVEIFEQFAKEPRIVKYILYQFFIKVSLLDEEKKKEVNLNDNIDSFFFSSFLLLKFPKVFNIKGEVLRELIEAFKKASYMKLVNSRNLDDMSLETYNYESYNNIFNIGLLEWENIVSIFLYLRYTDNNLLKVPDEILGTRMELLMEI